MNIVTSEQMRKIDEATISGKLNTGLELMEKAGTGLLEKSLEILSGKASPKTAIFCGKGNNGGDGFVLARLLSQKGIKVECFLLEPKDLIKRDAKTNLDMLEKLDKPVKVNVLNDHLPSLKEYSLVVDAIFGTGFSGSPTGIHKKAIDLINKFNGPILSVDAPSGTNMNTGNISEICVNATHTVTMGLPKVGHYFYPSRSKIGELIIHDLGYKKNIIKEEAGKVILANKQWAKNKLPHRYPNGHKGTFGKVLIIAGSQGMSGAAILSAKAALRSGTGMVIVASPKSVAPIISESLPEAMTLWLPETDTGTIAYSAIDIINKKINEWADVLVIGPGLGQHPDTSKLAREIIKSAKKTAIVDADGINAFANRTEEILAIPYPRILTPHIGEINRLWKLDKELNGIVRIDSVCKISENEFKNVIILKGATSITASPEGNCVLNSSGNSGMATAGSGDVLSGIIGGLVSQKMDAFNAASLGVYIHGLAGNLATEEFGEYSMISSDIIKYLPNAIKSVSSQI